MIYEFADCRIDTERLELTRDGAARALEPQVFAVLVHLVENRDRVVAKQELIAAVWDGRAVSDAAIDSRISAARRAVGDSGQAQTLIRTVSRRGYRFVAPVTLAGDDDDAPAPEATTTVGETSAMQQVVRLCAAGDGVQIAYAIAGAGPALVKTASWLNHLDYDWRSPVWGQLYSRLALSHTLLRYDSRGVGLSQRDVGEISFATFVADLEAAVDATGLARFALLGVSQGAAVAIRYAVTYPERVSHLVLWGGYARGPGRRGEPAEDEQARMFVTLMRRSWGQNHPAFQKMFAALYLPEATSEQVSWWIDLQRIATSPETAVKVRRAIESIDVVALLPHVRVPTLVLHSRDEAVAPLAEAQLLAGGIPDARFVLLDSANHIVLPQEAEWERAVSEIEGFLTSG